MNGPYLQNTKMKTSKARVLGDYVMCKDHRLLLLNCSEFDRVSKNSRSHQLVLTDANFNVFLRPMMALCKDTGQNFKLLPGVGRNVGSINRNLLRSISLIYANLCCSFLLHKQVIIALLICHSEITKLKRQFEDIMGDANLQYHEFFRKRRSDFRLRLMHRKQKDIDQYFNKL